MTNQLKTSSQMSFWDSTECICLPGSGYGTTHSTSADGEPVRCGREVAHANLSARQALELGFRTQDTFGQALPGSSNSEGLQSYLESRLRALLNGSHVCSVIWKPWITHSGQCLSRPRAQVRSILGTGFTLWPTPAARDWRSESASPEFYAKWLAHPKGKTLPMLLALAKHGSTDPMARSGQLNPAFTRWLMNLPAEWDDCAPMETGSTRRSRNHS